MSTNSTSAPGANEFSGKTVEEATAEGLRLLGLRADEATVEVVHRGSRGLFGIGSESAVVRIRRATQGAAPAAPATAAVQPASPAPAPRPAAAVAPATAAPAADKSPAPMPAASPAATSAATSAAAVTADEIDALPAGPERDEQVAALAGDMLLKIITLMGFDARVETHWRDADAITDDRHLLLSAHGRDLSALIGRRGETLENLQYLLRLMVNQKMHRWLNIIVDVEEFRAKRVEHLTRLAERMADQVTETQRSFALEPMPPNERRIVHLALRDSETVFTESTGEGERRKVTIFPKL